MSFCVFYFLGMVVFGGRGFGLFVFFIFCGWWYPVGGLMSCLFFIFCRWWCPVGGLMSCLWFLVTVDGGVL
jgi:hypothetical protein